MSGKAILGADLGYGFEKFVVTKLPKTDETKYLFPALITLEPTVPETFSGVDKKNPFKYYVFRVDNGPHYTVGEGVTDFADRIANENFALDRDIDLLEKWLFAAIGLYAQQNNIDTFSVGWAVPLKRKQEEVDKIKQSNLRGLHTIDISDIRGNGKTVGVEIDNIYIVEQTISAFFDLKFDFNKEGKLIVKDPVYRDGRVVLIDIGTNTIGTVFVDASTIQNKNMFSYSGVAEILLDMQTLLAEMGYVSSLASIQKKFILEKNPIVKQFKNGRLIGVDLSKEFEEIRNRTFKSRVKPIIDNFLKSLNVEEGIDRVVFCGGGVYLFDDLLKDSYYNGQDIIVHPDPAYANARGVWKTAYARESLKTDDNTLNNVIDEDKE